MRRRGNLRSSTRSALVDRPLTAAWDVVASGAIGPQWYVDAAPLRFRGALDRLVGGERRSPAPGRPLLEAGDLVGFWQVVDADHAAHRLVLEARVRAPGTVRLTAEAAVRPDGTEIALTVSLDPDGVLGAAYLLADLPARGVVAELTMLHLLTVLRRPAGTSPVRPPGKDIGG